MRNAFSESTALVVVDNRLLDHVLLPDLPTPQPPEAEASTFDAFATGRAFYVPPEAYVDPSYNNNLSQSLNSVEKCRVSFEVMIGGEEGEPLGRSSFILRRPPILLVHGIMSEPATSWSDELWGEGAGNPFQTRMYPVDWSSVNTKGYDVGYPYVVKKIQDALSHYRYGIDAGHDTHVDFDGVKYTATRVDVVAHSLGGQLTRFFIADEMPNLMERSHWLNYVQNNRSPNSSEWRWPYLRDNNFGAGDIRRFIPLGSPFRGSPIANMVEPIFANGDAGPGDLGNLHTALLAWEQSQLLPMPDVLREMLFEDDGDYIPPTCIADLAGAYPNDGFGREFGSAAMQALQQAAYPEDHRRVRWYPIAGIATQTPTEFFTGASAILEYYFFELIPALPGWEGAGQLAALQPSTSDLIVSYCSQVNLPNGCGGPPAPAGPGEIFEYTTHSVMVPGALEPIIKSETTSQPIRDRVAELLGSLAGPFDSSWSLGQ